MPWIYHQRTGVLEYQANGRTETVATGYSGLGAGRNNPSMQATHDTGPIPQGTYMIGPAHQGAHTGPVTMNLDPQGHNALGRTLLRIHGDSRLHPGFASNGCIILDRATRDRIARSTDRTLNVVQ